MSFNAVRTNTRSHFNEVQVHLNYVASLEPQAPSTPSMEVKILRGLFYVNLYSALERTINEVVIKTLMSISSKNVKHRHFTLAFNTITQNDRIKSIKDSGYKKMFAKSAELFQVVGNTDTCVINEMLFARNLQNVWVETINDVRGAFGMSDLDITPRIKATVNEIVEKRNSVAHGGETAAYVGERHDSTALRVKFQIVQEFTNKLIDEFEEYCNDMKYLKPIMKRHY